MRYVGAGAGLVGLLGATLFGLTYLSRAGAGRARRRAEEARQNIEPFEYRRLGGPPGPADGAAP
jgi:hypothetical protein